MTMLIARAAALLSPFGWLLTPLQALLTPFARVIAVCVCVALGLAFFKHHYVAAGVKAEAHRQETVDAKIAVHAAAAVHNPTARRVLDPSTDTTGQ